MVDIPDDDICWPEGFMNIGGRSFLWVFLNKKEWVDFTLYNMSKPTKLFKQWQNYVIQKVNRNNATSTSDEIRSKTSED